MKYHYKEISELGKVITGKTPPTENDAFFGGEFPFITPSDIHSYDEKYILETERTISSEGAKKLKGMLLSKGSICFVCIGSTIGKMCMTHKDSYTNQQINSLLPSDKYDNDYLFYYLRFIKGFFQSIGAGTGSGKGIINKTLFSKTKIRVLEDKIHQQTIAKILSAYDNLIENNNKRIKILEQMAENLYKEWFVRFRFPGHETTKLVASEMGKIPASFNMKKMQDVFEYYIGGGWGNDVCDKDFSEEASVIRGTDFPYVKKGDLSTCPVRYHKASNYKSRKLEDGDIILEVSGGTAEQPVGRTVLVSQQLIDRFNSRVICASFCKLVRLNKKIISPYFFYYWMQFLYNTRIIDRFQLQSTGIINFKFEHFLKKGCVMLPPRNLMEQFEGLIIPIHSEIEKLSMHNENLIKQRDLLLPRLMSGKLAV